MLLVVKGLEEKPNITNRRVKEYSVCDPRSNTARVNRTFLHPKTGLWAKLIQIRKDSLQIYILVSLVDC